MGGDLTKLSAKRSNDKRFYNFLFVKCQTAGYFTDGVGILSETLEDNCGKKDTLIRLIADATQNATVFAHEGGHNHGISHAGAKFYNGYMNGKSRTSIVKGMEEQNKCIVW